DLLVRSGSNPLTIVLTRARSDPAQPVREDEERALVRTFSLPAARTFALGGTARLSADAPDELLDAALGRPDDRTTGVVARSSGRLPGDIGDRAAAALDGDPSTWWSPGLGGQVGGWVEFTFPRRVTFDHLDLQLVDDRRHSVPTRLLLETDT